MLNVYCGREDIDKQRFLFERIAGADGAGGMGVPSVGAGPVFLIVPDQFTLEAERGAFHYLGVSAFIDPIVLSMNRLAGRVFAETGGRTDHIDQYGKYMLLARLLYRGKSHMELFKNLENSAVFIEKLSDAIMSLKAHCVTPDMLAACIAEMEADTLLRRKCKDLLRIYSGYEEALAAGRPDSTDMTRLFIERIPRSKQIADAVIWIYGFDYFAPVNLEAVARLAACAREVNVVLTAEPGNAFFALTNRMAEQLIETARAAGARTDAPKSVQGCAYRGTDQRPAEIAHIERALFSYPLRQFDGGSAPALRFVRARDFQSEAEAAAIQICRLVREEGFRYRDILVLCNDMGKRASAISRVFGAYGLPVFMDRRRDVDHDPVLEFILALPEIAANGRRQEDVFRWIRTGLTGIETDDAEELENYAIKYRLRGRKWGEPLRYGAGEYDEETRARLGEAAARVDEITAAFAKRFGAGRTGRERTEGLYLFLTEDCALPEKIAAYADELEEKGYAEYADELRGIWDVAAGVMDQIAGALGDLTMGMEEYAAILRAGFASVKMGVLPPSADSIVVGTMQRTRTSRVRAMFVLGANDGELPLFCADDGLISDVEKGELETLGIPAFRRDENLMHEEQLAIYKNLSKPTRLLYLSYTATGKGGGETKPSMIFERLRELFPRIPVSGSGVGDEVGDGEADTAAALYSEDSVLARLSEQIRRSLTGAAMDGIWNDVWLWYEKNRPEKAAALRRGLTFENRKDRIVPESGLTISPSAIEGYSRCPFSYFMDRGLHLGERRVHEADSRNMGEVYHDVLMRFGMKMNESGRPVSDTESLWNSADRAQTDHFMEEIFETVAAEYEQGLFNTGPYERYRKERLKRISKDVAWALTERVRDTDTERMIFETEFKQSGKLRELEIGQIKIAGRIDRVDILAGGYAKVVDYKSGGDTFHIDDVKSGWQLQLMIYLKAAAGTYKPAGVSYFRIFEPHIDVTKPGAPQTAEEIRDAVTAEYKNDGILIDLEGRAEAAGEGTGTNTGTNTGEKFVTRNEFDELQEAVSHVLGDLAERFAAGEMPARPKAKKKGGEKITACTYCRYRSVCNYDIVFET
ncbi:MAG: PD-(D/E)XK nuclease family protein [Clostridiales Family XIII bacterium]|jgi:ATP-dependent helicase/nuclease subunit B|nr:PD-(D/E)XK nuclease family protein [Clostridiales Family XIII bacterium]